MLPPVPVIIPSAAMFFTASAAQGEMEEASLNVTLDCGMDTPRYAAKICCNPVENCCRFLTGQNFVGGKFIFAYTVDNAQLI